MEGTMLRLRLQAHLDELGRYLDDWQRTHHELIEGAVPDDGTSASVGFSKKLRFSEGSAEISAVESDPTNETSNSVGRHERRRFSVRSTTTGSTSHTSIRSLWRMSSEVWDNWGGGSKSHPIDHQLSWLEGQAEHASHKVRNSALRYDSQTSRRCPRFDRIVRAAEQSAVFEGTCMFVIFANTVSLTLSTERKAMQLPESWTLIAVEEFCVWFYCLELVLRIAAQKSSFFDCGDSNSGWRYFDLLLVLLSLQEKSFEASGVNISYFRVMRLLKILKVLRIIRLSRRFKELRLILSSMACSVRSILWAVLMIIVVLFMFSLAFVNAVSDAGLDLEIEGQSPGWTSTLDGMLTLFMCATGGVNWSEVAESFDSVFYGLFLFYIAFFFFVIYNTITSLFVECVLENQANDDQLIVQTRIENRAKYMELIRSLFYYMDKHNTGSVSHDELLEHIRDERMLSFCASLDIVETDLRLFFSTLTSNGKFSVDLETFVIGCIKLRGTAKSLDVGDIALRLKRLASQQEKALVDLQEKAETQAVQLARLSAGVRSQLQLLLGSSESTRHVQVDVDEVARV